MEIQSDIIESRLGDEKTRNKILLTIICGK